MLPPGIEGVKLQDYTCGGYFLARVRKPGVGRPPSPRLPPGYFSVSGCLSDFFPDTWVWNYAGPIDDDGNLVEGISGLEERTASAARFGITPEQVPDVVRWGQMRCGHDFSIPRGFEHLHQARRATEWIGLPSEELVIFGIGLNWFLTAKFVEDSTQNADFTVPQCIRQGRPLSQGGLALGYELVNYQYGELSCSWICNGCENFFADRPGCGLNSHGYLDTFEAALECVRAIERGEVGAEPGPWYPWLMVRYE
jgi:hypothetical protein